MIVEEYMCVCVLYLYIYVCLFVGTYVYMDVACINSYVFMHMYEYICINVYKCVSM